MINGYDHRVYNGKETKKEERVVHSGIMSLFYWNRQLFRSHYKSVRERTQMLEYWELLIGKQKYQHCEIRIIPDTIYD